jgi:hypothetical protein
MVIDVDAAHRETYGRIFAARPTERMGLSTRPSCREVLRTTRDTRRGRAAHSGSTGRTQHAQPKGWASQHDLAVPMRCSTSLGGPTFHAGPRGAVGSA